MKGYLKKNLAWAVVACMCLLSFGALAEADSPDAAVEPEPLESMQRWLKKNPDTVGWLRVGWIIDMPVVQRDSEYYLDHNFYGNESSAGTVLMDEDNCILPRDTLLAIFGHNMRDGTVFGELDQYRRLRFLKYNPVVSFNTLYEEGQYAVIAVFDISAEEEDPAYMDVLVYNFDEDQQYADFIAEAQQRSYYEIPIGAQPGDHLLVLITCSYSNEDGRLVVMCRELRPDEDSQQMAEAMKSAREK